jgi:hypothetical protein
VWGFDGWGLRLVEVPVEVERVVYEERIVEVNPQPHIRQSRPDSGYI